MTATVTVDRRIDLDALPFPAWAAWDGTTHTITADVDRPTLQEAVDAAPDYVEPPTTDDRVDDITDRLTKAGDAANIAEMRDALAGRGRVGPPGR